nr:carboxymuconolactone decarboxylase family protein [Phenylobacterium glaciei]
MPPGVPPLVLFTTLASSDRAWRKFRAGSLLDGRVISLREREIVIDRACARAGCEYEWGVHITAFAKAAKLTRAEIAATLEYPLDRSKWRPREAALLATIDALHDRARLSDDEFDGLRAHFNPDQILEVLLLAGFYRSVAYLANGLNLPLETTAARFADFALG